ncbi:MAG: rubredoxin [Oculatellaceae cyanobacterium Prado106]|jgi:rubredoxin|nr:rubredoxin [Oculatellaceae cyanobacterium Prado106]
MEKYICKVCNYVYDPAEGDPTAQIEPGLPFETLPDEWHCPQCQAAKTEFEPEIPMPGMVVPVGE